MSNLAKSTLVLIIITMLSKVLGFGRELALTYVHGATAMTDAYITAMSIPGVIYASIGTAISTTFIPLFCEINRVEGKQRALKFANNIFNVVIVISFILSLLGFIFSKPLIKLFAMNFNGEKLNLAIQFNKIMIFGIIFMGLSSIMTAWLQMKGNFSIPGMIGFPYSICIIIGIIISSNDNSNILAIGTLAGIASQFLFQIPFAYKDGYRYKLYINIKDKYLKKMLILVAPVFIGVAVNQVNVVIDKSLASTIGDGVITVLNSANRLNGFVIGLFISTIASVIYPTLSKLSNDKNNDDFIQTIKSSINTVVILVIPISVGAIVLANPIVKIIFERGAFDTVSTNMTAKALIGYSIGMIGYGLREILNKVFYSIQDTKTPMINGILSVLINIFLNIILIKKLKYFGLALSTSISSIICILLLFKSFSKKIGYFGQDKILITVFKSLGAAIFMGIITFISYEFISSKLGVGLFYDIMSLFIPMVIGFISYSILAILLKIEEISIIINMTKKKIGV